MRIQLGIRSPLASFGLQSRPDRGRRFARAKATSATADRPRRAARASALYCSASPHFTVAPDSDAVRGIFVASPGDFETRIPTWISYCQFSITTESTTPSLRRHPSSGSGRALDGRNWQAPPRRHRTVRPTEAPPRADRRNPFLELFVEIADRPSADRRDLRGSGHSKTLYSVTGTSS